MSIPRFIVIDVVPPHTHVEDSQKRLEETIQLIHTLTGGVGIVSHIIQQRIHPDQTTYVGKGKVEELFDLVKRERIDTLVLNDIVSANQVYNLKMALWKADPDVAVWDRVDLILKIFQKHARTAEGKLQIELAAMQHMGPRIYGMGMIMSRQGGGVGTRGIGETNTERMKRHWRDAMREVKLKLEKFQKDQTTRIQKRREQGIRTVAIVGYTNAGKTTLFNALTGKHKLEKDVLFATLDSATGYLKYQTLNSKLETRTGEDVLANSSVHSPFAISAKGGSASGGRHSPILISDTIGFIKNLPPKLIQAFRSTLMETVNADLLVHVVDASDPDIEEKIETVQRTLHDLGVEDKPTIMVLNKVDLPPGADMQKIKDIIQVYKPVCLSANDSDSTKTLGQKIVETLQLRK
jgi:GTP-binding protein HflX